MSTKAAVANAYSSEELLQRAIQRRAVPATGGTIVGSVMDCWQTAIEVLDQLVSTKEKAANT